MFEPSCACVRPVPTLTVAFETPDPPKPAPSADALADAVVRASAASFAAPATSTSALPSMRACVLWLAVTVVFARATPTNPPVLDRVEAVAVVTELAAIVRSPAAATRELEPMYACVGFVALTVIVAFETPTPTKPPVSFFALAARLSASVAVMVMSAPAVAMPALPVSRYALTFGFDVTVAELTPTPTKPPPEPVELARDSASPGAPAIVLSDAPPGARRWWLVPGTVVGLPFASRVGMSMRSSCVLGVPAAAFTAVRSTVAVKECPAVLVRPVLSSVRAVPPGVSAIWNVVLVAPTT